jgi:hypothetical protein
MLFPLASGFLLLYALWPLAKYFNAFAIAIALHTLSRTVIETCKAIIWALKDNIKVRNPIVHSKQFINLAICCCKYKLL